MKGLLYRLLVRMHPATFRRQFGAEMELIFEDSGRAPGLLADIFVSLLRQWMFRNQLWILGAAALGGTIPFALGMGFLGAANSWFGIPPHVRPIHSAASLFRHSAAQTADAPFLMLTSAIAVMFISGTMILTIAWFGYSQRSRRARKQR